MKSGDKVKYVNHVVSHDEDSEVRSYLDSLIGKEFIIKHIDPRGGDYNIKLLNLDGSDIDYELFFNSSELELVEELK